LKVAAPGKPEPEEWFELGFLWFALTGKRPDPALEGWAWFFREHLTELTEALGPGLEKTKASYNEKQKESAEIMRRYVPPPTLLVRLLHLRSRPLVGSLLMGPLGWLVALALLLIWAITR
jgi:hypothetical protein